MARYIDADALLSKMPEDLPYKASVKRVLMQAPESPTKFGGYHEVNVVEETAKSLEELIGEAYITAMHEGIEANTVLLNEHFVKVNEFPFTFGMNTGLLPPMICGLQVYVSKELPDGYDFGVLKAPMTEREAIAWEAKRKVAREIFEDIDRMIFGTVIPNECAIISTAQLAELKKKYTEGK